MKITVLGRPTSWNTIYSSRSYWTRKTLVDQEHARIHAALLEMGILPNKVGNLFKGKVDIDIKAYFKNRIQDSDNLTAKLFIDGLRGYVLINDDPNYVGRVSTESVIGLPERVEIEIIERNDEY